MPPKLSDQDQRRFIRIPKEADLTINKLEYPLNGTTVEAKTKNLSSKGICFLTSTPYQVDSLLNLKIELQGWQNYLQSVSSIVDSRLLSKPLTAICQVVWTKKIADESGYEVGVRFQDIYEDDYQAFYKYLDKFTL